MHGMAKLSSQLPKGEANGLAALDRDLIDNPAKVQVIVAPVDCRKLVTDMDSGDIEPTARIRRVEVIREDAGVVAAMLRRAMETRTGKTVLPFDLENDLRGVFDGIDHATGEVLDPDDQPKAD